MKQSFWTRKILISFLITLLTGLVLLSLYALFGRSFDKINYLMRDTLLFQGAFSTNTKFNDVMLIVEIDDKTLLDSEKGGLGRWQDFKRSYYATVIDNLKKDGALVVGIDSLFSEKSKDGNEDEILAKSIKDAGNVVLNYHYLNKLYPIDILKASTNYLGDIRPFVNPINNIIYSYITHYTSNGKAYESFSMAVLRAYYDEILGSKEELQYADITDKGFKLHNKFIDYSGIKYSFGKGPDGNRIDGYEFLINYIPNKHLVNKASFVDIYKGNYDPKLVKDKIILLGASATALHDEYNAPILTEDGTGIIPGVYFHALTINTILNGKYIYYMSTYKELILLMIFIFIITFFLLSFSSRIGNYMNAFGIILFPLVFIMIFIFAFNKGNYIFRMPSIYIFGIIIADAAGMVYRYYYEDLGKRILYNALSQYVSKDVADEIIQYYQEVSLKEGKETELVVFFSDIEGFTGISEKLDTKELFEFLRDYIKEMSDVILENRGQINKYEGDGIMALWGDWKHKTVQNAKNATISAKNDSMKAYNACVAAINQIKKISVLNEKYKIKYGFEIKIRIGINLGMAKVGNIGSEGRKLELTALGDNVNLGSRLEGINKYYGTKICISESTKDNAKGDFIYRFLDEIIVKGKRNSLKIFELVGMKNETPAEKVALIREFEKALLYYREGFFGEAQAIFIKLSELGDIPSQVFISRCSAFQKNPPGENWKGVWEFDTK